MTELSKLKHFDPQKATYMHAIMIVGKKASGKTTLVKDLLSYMNCDYVKVMKQDNMNDDHHDVCDEIIDDGYSENKIATIFNRHRDNKDSSSCIIFDDCLVDEAWVKHLSMKRLIINGPCIKTNTMIVTQYSMNLPQWLISNMDHVFIFKEPDISHRNELYKSYATMILTFQHFCDLLDEIEKIPFACLVLNYADKYKRFEDQVMFYTAKSQK